VGRALEVVEGEELPEPVAAALLEDRGKLCAPAHTSVRLAAVAIWAAEREVS
jgi:hypothetical protein